MTRQSHSISIKSIKIMHAAITVNSLKITNKVLLLKVPFSPNTNDKVSISSI